MAVDCHGIVQLQLARRAVALGKARYSILNGTTKAIKVRLNESARRRLAHARHGLRVAVVTKPEGAPSRRKTVRLRGR